MLHRIRAHIRYPRATGLATWSRDNMHVRYLQAIHVRQGEPEEEPPVNKVVQDGNDDIFICDLALMDEAHTIDAFNTLTSPSVFGQSLSSLTSGGLEPSWVEHHVCFHNEDNVQPCLTISIERGP